jgi:hypothetical protein
MGGSSVAGQAYPASSSSSVAQAYHPSYHYPGVPSSSYPGISSSQHQSYISQAYPGVVSQYLVSTAYPGSSSSSSSLVYSSPYLGAPTYQPGTSNSSQQPHNLSAPAK